MDGSKKIESVSHTAEKDHQSVHNAINKASKDSNFISHVVEQLDTLKFPAYKLQILAFIQNKSSDENVIGLLRSLNDTVLFQDKYDVKQRIRARKFRIKTTKPNFRQYKKK